MTFRICKGLRMLHSANNHDRSDLHSKNLVQWQMKGNIQIFLVFPYCYDCLEYAEVIEYYSHQITVAHLVSGEMKLFNFKNWLYRQIKEALGIRYFFFPVKMFKLSKGNRIMLMSKNCDSSDFRWNGAF